MIHIELRPAIMIEPCLGKFVESDAAYSTNRKTISELRSEQKWLGSRAIAAHTQTRITRSRRSPAVSLSQGANAVQAQRPLLWMHASGARRHAPANVGWSEH